MTSRERDDLDQRKWKPLFQGATTWPRYLAEQKKTTTECQAWKKNSKRTRKARRTAILLKKGYLWIS